VKAGIHCSLGRESGSAPSREEGRRRADVWGPCGSETGREGEKRRRAGSSCQRKKIERGGMRALGPWPARLRSSLRGEKKARPLGLSAGEMGLARVLFFSFYFKAFSKQFKICLKYF